ncbi:PBCV-specific basic adaptor domain-containing protein [Acanthocystis turfacea Chlorella virus Canal-1]|nr:PBCV-specific basic adaptor domain-containing protein [Acanthocystis turfacea Chlorella virus Canal-1]
MDYAFSAKRKGGIVSHTIPRGTRKMKNLAIPSGKGVNKTRPMPGAPVFRASSFGGKLVGSGVNGKVYLVTVTPELKNALKDGLNKGGAKVFDEFPEVGSKAIVKVVSQKKEETDDDFFAEVSRENVVHKELASNHCYKIPGAVRARCISQFVPKFYMSFALGSPKKHSCVTVMAPAGNMTLKDYLQDLKKVHASGEKILELYTCVELIVCSLWLSGFAHGDLHLDNLLITKGKGNVTYKLIDFGFAMKVPEPFVKLAAEGMTKMIKERSIKSFADLWTKDSVGGVRLVNYSNRVIKGRGYEWYNPDYKILQLLYNLLPAKQRAELPDARSKAWGVPLSGNENELEEGEIRVEKPVPKPKWVPRDGKYWADEPSPSPYRTPSPTPARKPSPKPAPKPVPKPAPKPVLKVVPAVPNPPSSAEIGKVDAKKRPVFKNSKGRTYVKSNGKKVYVKKLFTPKTAFFTPKESPKVAEVVPSVALTPGSKETGKVNAKARTVFEDSKGRKYVKAGGKRVYVKKLFTPKAASVKVKEASPAVATTPGSKETGKVNAKNRKVFEDSKGRKYVKAGGKRVYVKKLFTPKRS